jgi:DNA-binding NarL/FixJ family response regulator
LEWEPDFDVTAEREMAAASAGIRHDSVDVVLVDERIAGAMSAGTRAALAALTRRALVVVMGIGDPTYYEQAHVEAGAVGYWPKDGDVDALIRLVRAAGLVARADRACVAERRHGVDPFQRRRAEPPATMGTGNGAPSVARGTRGESAFA